MADQNSDPNRFAPDQAHTGLPFVDQAINDAYRQAAETKARNTEQNAGLPAYTGPAGQGWYHPDTGQVDTTYSQGAMGMNRPGIDRRSQGWLRDPYAGDYGGAPGVAEGEENRYAGLASAARGALAPQMDLGQYNADRGLDLNSRGNQDYALQQYKNMIAGNGPSVAQTQMNQGLSQAMAQQAAISASARGGGANLVAAQQAASNAAGNASANIVQGAGLARVQEQLGALNSYGGMANAMRGQDQSRAGLSNQNAFEQSQLQAQQNSLNAQTGLGYEGMRQNVFNAQQAGMEYNESQNQNTFAGGQGIQVQRAAQDQAQTNSYVDAGLTAGSIALKLLSDVRKKKDIGDGKQAVREQLSAMAPYEYAYKNPSEAGAGPGQRVGVMAQDMERGPYGSQLVKDTPRGKMIDGPGGLSLALAGSADHEKRLQALEGGGGGGKRMIDFSDDPAAFDRFKQVERPGQPLTDEDLAFIDGRSSPGLASAAAPAPSQERPSVAAQMGKEYLTGGVPLVLMNTARQYARAMRGQ